MAKILIVDDSSVEIKIMRNFLQNWHEIIEAREGKEALALAAACQPDLILLDIIMPGLDGFAICRALKSRVELADIPVIFITSATQIRDVVEGFRCGGQDYIIKPFYALELQARIKVHLELRQSQKALQQYILQVEQKNEELKEMMEKLEISAKTDYITGLANRRCMMETLQQAMVRLQEKGGQDAILLGDIDNFKRINDTYGHECGDMVLKTVAECMQSVLGSQNYLSRWGGEEFLMLLPGSGLAEAKQCAERVREAIAQHVFVYRSQEFTLTITLSVLGLTADSALDDSIRVLDNGLYLGKRCSRNCVVDSRDGSIYSRQQSG
ncbi:diguanylate cyclase [Sporomusa sphaeroides]|uniref:Response regulator PleD n=1 Tax=Sporomusa sphaeroides DSM 2875 TaxID=1337886 RepID=A0ABM9W9R6_9FIRM|nr:diguanylate cyclase [Sporomusa sphaeroides]OLS55357.1 response regulator PleD [Sporomusa sphaeroides DSM 2875]CVK21265.1 Response regulator PleD [Sporomusa sphaeroides DSM 2875]